MTILDIMKSIARKTSPVLWTIPMGTGSISILFFAFPYGQASQPMAAISLIIYFLNIALFVLFNALTIARFVIQPESLASLLLHPSKSLFFGCYPMGAATILSVSISVVYQYYGFGGKPFIYFIWVLWWINVAISALCVWGGTHLMITRHTHSLPTMTAAWILPVVTFVVASSAGGLIAQALPIISIHSAIVTLTVSAFMVTVGLLLASMMLVAYILRLVTHGFPPGLTVLSVFLPLGVAAQAGYSISLLGAGFKSLLPFASSPSSFFSSRSSGDIINIFSSVTSFALWSWAIMWITYALLGLVHILRRTRIKFKMTAWGLVFPNGVFANLTIRLAEVFDSGFFRVVGAIYSILTFLLWCYISYNSILLLPSLFKNPPTDVHDGENEKRERNDIPQTLAGLPTHAPPYIPRTVSVDSVGACRTLGYENSSIDAGRHR